MMPAQRYRFGVFEVDAGSGELRRQGLRVKLHQQPLQVLLLLLARPGEVLTREEISRELWPDGTFVDYEHGVNSAVNRLREALGDKASQPRYVETLARRGYRFVGLVERVGGEAREEKQVLRVAQNGKGLGEEVGEGKQVLRVAQDDNSLPDDKVGRAARGMLATEEDLPASPPQVVRVLFLLLQLMYVGFYVGALANLAEISDLVAVLPYASALFTGIVATAGALIPLRAFLFCGVLFKAPRMRLKFLTVWPVVMVMDLLWALAPFLLLHHINYGVALACTTLLVYAPFAQRSLMLMGAAGDGVTSARG